MPPKTRKTSGSPSASATEAAYNELLSEIDAIEDNALAPMNLDVARVVSLVLAVEPRLLEMQPKIAPLVGLEPVRRLRNCALAAWHADLEARAPAAAPVALRQVAQEAAALRRRLLSDAEALTVRGLVDKDRVAFIRRGRGHLDTANDLLQLATLFQEHEAQLAGKTPVTKEELKQARSLGTALLVTRARSDQAPRDRQRARAFTLLLRNYDEVRRAVSFLRWHEGDAEALAPNPYAVRKPRSKRVRRVEVAGGVESASDNKDGER